MHTKLILILLTVLSSLDLWAQSGVRGYVRDESGNPLPFTTVYIRNLNTGAATNTEGYYELQLAPGKYDLVFQFIGYDTQVQFVEVDNGYQDFDLVLKTRVLMLREVEVRAGKEDPAYSIMRKAIGKAKYHTQQIDSFSAQVYVKGSGRVLDAPFFLRKQMEKEGIDSTMAFTSETYSELLYRRPNKIVQKVIAVYAQGEDNDTGIGEIITASFYEPEVADAISPLSPKAFAYYRFEYIGSFMDRGYLINEIKVTPRSRGDRVFTGTIFIVEDFWSIHSLDLSSSEFGLNFDINQTYAPIYEVAWLPISLKLIVTGSFFGFDFEYNYLGTIKDYQIVLNPDLAMELTVIDDKIEKEKSEEISRELSESEQTLQALAAQKEVTRKDLRKMMREYEKEELKRQDEPEVLSESDYLVDTNTQFNVDSAFWASVRPVPLTSYEKKGYIKLDSMVMAEKEEEAEDSLKAARRKTFRLYDIILGNTYQLDSNWRFQIRSPLLSLNYNTVEGYNFSYDLNLTYDIDSARRVRFGPVVRYAFARKKVVGKFYSRYYYGTGLRDNRLSVEGGRYVAQLNEEEPIPPIVNTFTALLLEENYIKLFEKDYFRVRNKHYFRDNLNMDVSFEFARRRNLQNETDHSWVKRDNRTFTPNDPPNLEVPDTGFETHNAAVFEIEGEYAPWQRYTIRNDVKSAITSSSPTFSLRYKKGISGLFSSDVDYDLLELGLKHGFEIGIRNNIDLKVNAGKFLNTGGEFIDFKHFPGNQTPFATTDPTSSFRLLDYYLYSTEDRYLTGFLHNQFRRLMITQFVMVRSLGLKENVFVNYLNTQTSDHYTEIGYGLDYIFRVFRLEAIAAFQGGQYQDIGFRIGIATNLEDLFN